MDIQSFFLYIFFKSSEVIFEMVVLLCYAYALKVRISLRDY